MLPYYSKKEKMEKERQETLDFIENNPFPDLNNFVKLMYQISKKNNSSFVVIGSYDYRILKQTYENILDEDIIKECGEFLYSKDGMKAMLKFHDFIDEIITYNFNKGNNEKYDRIKILSLPRLIEHWWDGIGEWMA